MHKFFSKCVFKLYNLKFTIKSRLFDYIIQNTILDYVIQNMEVKKKIKKYFHILYDV